MRLLYVMSEEVQSVAGRKITNGAPLLKRESIFTLFLLEHAKTKFLLSKGTFPK